MNWPTAKLKYVAKLGYGDSLSSSESASGQFRAFGSNGPYGWSSTSNTKPPSIIIGRKGSYGKINWAPDACFASDTTFFIDSTTCNHDLRWLYWLLQTLELDKWTDEAAVPGLNREVVYSKIVAIPPRAWQRAIADYLDRETARLDALVAAKERLLKLLAEKRRAIIARAVTRGLDTIAPFRDCETIDSSQTPQTSVGRSERKRRAGRGAAAQVARTDERELPAGWANPPVYARYSVQLGKMLDERRISGTHLAPYLRNTDIQWDNINTADLPEMDFDKAERDRYALQRGDLLICEGGEVGRTAEWNGELRECFFQKAIHRLRPITEQDEPGFFRYFMRMAADRGDFTLSTASTIQHLTAEKLRVVRYPAPPRDEQRAIVDYLDRETSRLDTFATTVRSTIVLLKERRAALITAAVTGRLDIGSES